MCSLPSKNQSYTLKPTSSAKDIQLLSISMIKIYLIITYWSLTKKKNKVNLISTSHGKHSRIHIGVLRDNLPIGRDKIKSIINNLWLAIKIALNETSCTMQLSPYAKSLDVHVDSKKIFTPKQRSFKTGIWTPKKTLRDLAPFTEDSH